MAAQNKIQFGLKNVYYAKLTETTSTSGVTTYSYGSPKPWKGAVNMSLAPNGDTVKEFADDAEWYTLAQNNGYEGDFEYEVMPEDFRTDILGETLDAKGVFFESSNSSTVYFALLFEIDGDAFKRRNAFLKCSATRETLENATKGESLEPTHGTITISAVPRGDGKVLTHTSKDVNASVYNAWFTNVYDTASSST